MAEEKLDRRKVRTRQLLRDALMALIAEKGYAAITVQDITDRANLGRATFYLHYRDKDELLAGALEALFDDLRAQVDVASMGNWLDSQPPSLRAFQHAQQYHALYKVLLSEQVVTYVARRVRQYLMIVAEHSLKALVPDTQTLSIPAPIIASYIAGALYSLVIWWLENDMPHSPEYMAQMFSRLVLPGAFLAVGLRVPEYLR